MAEHQTNLPRDDSFAEGERESQLEFQRLCVKHSRFIPRIPDAPPDRGADGSLELREQAPGDSEFRATGRRAWFQLKHTSSPNVLADGSISYPLETKNINYLGNYPCPFYVLYVRATGQFLFRWWRDVHVELDRDRPSWNTQQEVNIRFSRVVDDAVLKEIEIEINAWASQAAKLSAGPSFLRDVSPDAVRLFFDPDALFVGRIDELQALERRIGRGKVVSVLGLPDSGKSELIRQCLADATVFSRIEGSIGAPLALLVVDLEGRLEPCLLRGLAHAIGVNKTWHIDTTEAPTRASERMRLFREDFPGRVQGQRIMAVIESAEDCLNSVKEVGDLDEFLALDSFRSGCALIVSRSGAVPVGKARRSLQAELTVGFMPPDDARDLLGKLGIEGAVSTEIVEISKRDFPELLLPGVLRRGAGLFMVRSASSGTQQTADALFSELISASTHLTDELLAELGCSLVSIEQLAKDSLATLLVLSVVSEQPISDAELIKCGLPLLPIAKLHGIGWVENLGVSFYRLSSFGRRSLRRKLEELVTSESSGDELLSFIADSLERFLDVLMTSTSDEGFDTLSRTLEDAVAWIRKTRLRGTRLDSLLVEKLLPYAVDDIFFPVITERAPSVSGAPPGKDTELSAAVAELVLAVRSGVQFEEFLNRFRTSVEIGSAAGTILPVHLRAMDLSAYIGQRRYHRDREIFEIRQKLFHRMTNPNEHETADVGLLKWSASWALNTVALAVRLGEVSFARTALSDAQRAVSRLPAPTTRFGTRDKLSLTSRLAQLEGRVQADRFERTKHLRKAMDDAFSAMIMDSPPMRSVPFALNAAKRLASELTGEEERQQILNEVRQHLVSTFGPPAEWPRQVQLNAGNLVLSIATINADPRSRLTQLEYWRDVFGESPTDGSIRGNSANIRALLCMARMRRFVGDCYFDLEEPKVALEHYEDALRVAALTIDQLASAAGWELYLSLLDKLESAGSEGAWYLESEMRREAGPKLHRELLRARQWLANTPFWGTDEARLALWCLRRTWQGEGSIERWAARKEEVHSEWEDLANSEKVRLLTKWHLDRQRALDTIERRAGPLLDLHLTRIRNEAQFQRSIANYRKHVLNIEPVVRYFRSASKLWPDNHSVVLANASFCGTSGISRAQFRRCGAPL